MISKLLRFLSLRQTQVLALTLLVSVNFSSCALFEGFRKNRDDDGETTPTAANLDSYRMAPGSVVAMEMFESGGLLWDKNLVVDPEGDLILPEVGAVSVEGMAPLDVATKVEYLAKRSGQSHLSGPRVHIKALDQRAVVHVTGEVEKPGAVAYSRGMTAAQAIEAAGGITDKANENTVGLSSEGRKKIIMNPEKRSLREGEVVNVPKRFSR